jgi:hypothetical protein
LWTKLAAERTLQASNEKCLTIIGTFQGLADGRRWPWQCIAGLAKAGKISAAIAYDAIAIYRGSLD